MQSEHGLVWKNNAFQIRDYLRFKIIHDGVGQMLIKFLSESELFHF